MHRYYSLKGRVGLLVSLLLLCAAAAAAAAAVTETTKVNEPEPADGAAVTVAADSDISAGEKRTPPRKRQPRSKASKAVDTSSLTSAISDTPTDAAAPTAEVEVAETAEAGDSSLPLPPESPDEDQDERGSDRLSLDGGRLQLRLPDGTPVGSLEIPVLDRHRRKLTGLKTLTTGLVLFLILLVTRQSGPLTLAEQTAMTMAFVGLVRFLQSLFSEQGEFQFKVSVQPGDLKDELVGEVEYGGLADAKRSLQQRLQKWMQTLYIAVPTFFLVSGFFMTLGFHLATGLMLGLIFFILGGLASLIGGAGGAFADLIRSF